MVMLLLMVANPRDLKWVKTIEAKGHEMDILLAGASDLKVDSMRNRVVILDPAEGQVYSVDLGSGAVQVMGRKGSGPGEFTKPTQVVILSDGGVLVSDPNTRELELFDALGVPVKTYRFPDSPPLPRVLRLTDEDFLFVLQGTWSYTLQSPGEELKLAVRMNLAGEVAYEIAKGKVDQQPFLSAMAGDMIPLLKPDGTMVLVHTVENRVEVYAGKTLQKSSRFKCFFEPREPKVTMSEHDGRVSLFPEVDTVVVAAAVTPAGKVFALINTESTFQAWMEEREVKKRLVQLDDQTGALLGVWTVPASTVLLDVLDENQVFLVHDNEEGDRVLALYQL